MISSKNEKIDLFENKFEGLQKILKMLTPFRVLIGIYCLFMSAIIFFSLLITTYDKVNNFFMFLIELIKRSPILNVVGNAAIY